MLTDWLDRVIGLERWPDAGFWNAEPGQLTDLLGFTKDGFPVFTGPPGSPPPTVQVVTAGTVKIDNDLYQVGSFAAAQVYQHMLINDPTFTMKITGI